MEGTSVLFHRSAADFVCDILPSVVFSSSAVLRAPPPRLARCAIQGTTRLVLVGSGRARLLGSSREVGSTSDHRATIQVSVLLGDTMNVTSENSRGYISGEVSGYGTLRMMEPIHAAWHLKQQDSVSSLLPQREGRSLPFSAEDVWICRSRRMAMSMK